MNYEQLATGMMNMGGTAARSCTKQSHLYPGREDAVRSFVSFYDFSAKGRQPVYVERTRACKVSHKAYGSGHGTPEEILPVIEKSCWSLDISGYLNSKPNAEKGSIRVEFGFATSPNTEEPVLSEWSTEAIQKGSFGEASQN